MDWVWLLPYGWCIHYKDKGLIFAMNTAGKRTIGVVLFEGFETLDVFGPVEMWGHLAEHRLLMLSQKGGLVKAAQGISVASDCAFADAPQLDILMVPGGIGTRREVGNETMLDFLRSQDVHTEWTASVCTGSALLANAGVLKKRRATSNKMAFDFAVRQDPDVLWQRHARWVADGKYLTSSGVSAGIDMALCLVEKLYGRACAEIIAKETEYLWNPDPNADPFAG